MRLFIVLAMVCVFSSFEARAESVRSLVNGGNDLYKEKKFTDAEVDYRKALEKKPDLVQGRFNLGNALYKQEKFDTSAEEFENAVISAQDQETKSRAFYNLGNAQIKGQKYQEAVTSYTESLKRIPNDPDAKYNLSYALLKLKAQQQDGGKGQDKSGKDKNEKNKQSKQGQQQQKNQQAQQQKVQQKNQQEKKMSKADAERILDLLKNSEKDVRKKLLAKQMARVKVDKDW
ncbi:MAG: tetratricopeptide repeat protein [Nitrospirae bacterium]|nr:tetratricopeptide repeat protein [Candidatus Troglogloeales bacterium]